MWDSKKRLRAPVRLLSVVLAIAILAFVGYSVFLNNGTLEISATPADVSIYIDEKPAKNITKVSAGQHTIKVAKDGYAAFFRNIKVVAGTTKKISPYLKKLPESKLIADKATFITQHGSDVYYTSNDALYKKTLDKEQQITPSVLKNVKKILLLPNEQEALILKDNNLYFYDFKRYDLVNQTSTEIANNVGDLALSNDGSKIVYSSFPSTGERLIILSNANGSNSQIIYNLKEINSKNPKLSYSSNDSEIFLADKHFYLLSLITSEITKITDSVSYTLPSPSSPMILAADSANNLKIIDYQGKVQYALKSQTPIEKISWIKDSNNLVMAVENTLYKVSLADLKMIPCQTTLLGNITRLLSVDEKTVLYIADNKLFQVDLITGWEQ